MVNLVSSHREIMSEMPKGTSLHFIATGGREILLNASDYLLHIAHALAGQKIPACNIILMKAKMTKPVRNINNRPGDSNPHPHLPVFAVVHTIEPANLFVNLSSYYR